MRPFELAKQRREELFYSHHSLCKFSEDFLIEALKSRGMRRVMRDAPSSVASPMASACQAGRDVAMRRARRAKKRRPATLL